MTGINPKIPSNEKPTNADTTITTDNDRDKPNRFNLVTGKSSKKAIATATNTGINRLLKKYTNKKVEIKITNKVTALGSEKFLLYQSLNSVTIIFIFPI